MKEKCLFSGFATGSAKTTGMYGVLPGRDDNELGKGFSAVTCWMIQMPKDEPHGSVRLLGLLVSGVTEWEPIPAAHTPDGMLSASGIHHHVLYDERDGGKCFCFEKYNVIFSSQKKKLTIPLAVSPPVKPA